MRIAANFDVPYGHHPRERADVFVPHDGAATTIIFWHGGSWQSGNKRQYRFVARAMARLGYRVVVPNYRLYPEVAWPVFAQDAARVVAWVAATYPSKHLVAMGHSAGAQIAASVAFDHTYMDAVDTAAIDGFIGLAGAYTFEPGKALKPILEAGGRPWQSTALVSNNPVPSLLVHGRMDRLVEVAATQKLAAAIQGHGGRVTTCYYRWLGHFTILAPFVVGWWAFPGLRRRLAQFARSL